MKTCPRCTQEHQLPGIYCSRVCANLRIHTQESKAKIAKGVAASNAANPRPKEQYQKAGKKTSQTLFLRLFEKPFDDLTKIQKKRIVLHEQDGKCLWCNLSEWLDKPMTFELDHVDGNNENNTRVNLRVLCPNCHSQTPTWRKAKSHPAWSDHRNSKSF